MQSIPSDYNSVIPWEKASPKAQRELVIKKLAVGIVALANLAGIAALFTYITLHVPISTSPLVVSPFVVGVLGALTYLEFPTFGITKSNYKHFTNPATILARAVTTVVFGPVVLMIKWLDWTRYGDPYVAKQIKKDFASNDFDNLMTHYGPKAKNLQRYGYISLSQRKEMERLYKEAKPHLETKQFLTEENAQEDATSTQLELDKISQNWPTTKKQIETQLPSPLVTPPNFSKTSTKIKVWFRKTFGVYTLA